MLQRIIIIFYCLFIFACTQEPTKIIYKGHNYYGKNIADKSIYERPASKSRPKTKVESGGTIVDEAEVENYVTAKSGDSLFIIAKQNKIPLRSLIEANNLEPPYKLYPGDKIKIPSERNTHIVQYADNISTIANQYGISSNDIISLNNLTAPYIIRPGQILILPYNIVMPDTKLGSRAKPNPVLAGDDEIKAPNVKIKFIYPINGPVVLKYGEVRNGIKSDGINISSKKGTPVKATADGKIVYVGNALKGYGNLIVIKHDAEWLSAYAHNDEVYVTKNQIVKQGEAISTVGVSGDVDKPQLYFSLRQGRKTVDPKKYLSDF